MFFKTLLAIFFICLLNNYVAESQKCFPNFGVNNTLGTCSAVDECRGAALIGTCSKSLICCINDTSSTGSSDLITRDIFLKVAGNTTRNEWLYGHFVDSLKPILINNNKGENINRIAAYLSQLLGETDFFRSIESPIKEKDIDTNIGNNKSGDGSLYRGRGAILLRGRLNYRLATEKSGLNLDFYTYPEFAAFPSYAFKLGAWFWTQNAFVVTSPNLAIKESLNKLVDGTFFNFSMLTHSLTNNLQSLKQRANLNELILREINNLTLKRGQGIVCSDGEAGEKGYAVPICLADFKKTYCGCEGKYNPTSCPYGFNFEKKCRNSALVKCCVEKKCKASLDLVILTDSSRSIGYDNFQLIKNFVSQLVKNLPIGYNETRVSIINFSYSADIIINLEEGTNLDKILENINSIPFIDSGTATFLALKKANQEVLVESAGMRPLNEAVPKVVMVITDGVSDDRQKTLAEAKKIKDRKFNIISVGIGRANIDELNDMASSPNDVYYVDQFDKILQIITSLSRTTCLQAAEIPSKTEIKASVEKDSYKYFRLDLFKNDSNSTDKYLSEFTFELKFISGRTELFYSFDDENPKSPSEYLNDNSNPKDENFIEKFFSDVNKLMREKLYNPKIKSAENNSTNYEKKLYPVKIPPNGQNEIVYFSVKGLSDENEFQVYIYEEYIEIPSKASNTLTIVLIVVFVVLTIVLVIGVFFGARYFRKK